MRWLQPLRGFAMTMVLLTASAAAADDVSSLQAAFLRGDYESVSFRSKDLLRRGDAPADPILYLQGVSALKLRDWEVARSSLTRLIEEHPRSGWVPQARLALGDSLAASEKYPEALEAYGRVVRESKPLLPQAAFRLGRVQRHLGLWDQARASFERVLQAAPSSEEAALVRQILEGSEFYFTVQVGAFVGKANASKLQAELRRRGHEAEVTEGDAQGKIFHRVRVGHYSTRQEALEEAGRLERDGFPAKVLP